MNNNTHRDMILHENMWKVMVRLSWPAVIAMVLYGLNTIFDAVFIGRFVGETALAGISMAYPLSQISLGLGSLAGVGAGSALSIAIGSSDHYTQKRIIGNMNYLTVLFAAALTIIALILCKPLVAMMGATGESLVQGTDYFRVTLYGSVLWISGLAGNMVVRAEGKMGFAAVMMGIGLLVNIAANYLLIVILDYGVKGAAWGTNLGMFIYTFLFFLYAKSRHISFEAKAFSIHRDPHIIKAILSNGIPSFIMTFMTLIQGIVVLNALGRYGSTTDIAFYGIVYRIFIFMLTPIFGLMRALQPAVGINFGARKYERVISNVKIFTVAGLVLMLPLWLVMLVNPQAILHIMLPSAEFIHTDLWNFRIFIMLLPVLPVMFMAMTFFPAIDEGNKASVIGIIRQIVFYIPVMLTLPRFFGVRWVYIGSFLIDLIMIAWAIVIILIQFKKLRILKR
ncbi:MAG: MATE family efflux transporter [Sphaerochaetaceae bacterium]|nr:MATE family efflux transporter [Sphaerochaetaceae bacterium]